MRILNKATARAHGAVDQAADAAAPAEQWLEEQARYIAGHPLQSLGLAFAAGYLLSRLAR